MLGVNSALMDSPVPVMSNLGSSFGMDTILPQQRAETVLLMADRFARASWAMESWATDAKQCVDFLEGKQWSAKDLAQLEADGRPALVFNRIAPLVRIVLGYHRNNRTDVRYLPGNDLASSDKTAQILTKVVKQISQMNQEPYIDTEVFLDGITTGRGFYDHRISFENNDFGEVKITAKDPFSIYLDPEASEYDLNSGNFVMESRWTSLDEIAFTYGASAAAVLQPLVARSGYSGMPASITAFTEEKTPWRTFGGNYHYADMPYLSMEGFLAQSIDPTRKNIRLIDCQHYVMVWQSYILDLETGDKHVVPDSYDQAKVDKILAWGAEQYAKKGRVSPLRLVRRMGRRARWTTMVGDIIVYDAWSPYESFTLNPFFPYWRRGQTRGMIHDLIDPQREINKRRSASIDIVTRTAHSGWMYHKSSLDDEQKQNIEENGAAPGINVEWQGDPALKPERIQPGIPPQAMSQLEQESQADLKEISGVNDSLLGLIDQVQSGRAIEARQRQGVISIQMYMDNMSRTKDLGAKKKLELVQGFYTEPRIVRIIGDDGKQTTDWINQQDDITGEVINDVTLGKYEVAIDETPLAATFAAAQFDELTSLIKDGIIPGPAVMDIAVDVSSLPQKEVIKQRVQAMMSAQGIPVNDQVGQQPQPPVILGPNGQPIQSSVPGQAPGGIPPGQPAQPGAPQAAPTLAPPVAPPAPGAHAVPVAPQNAPHIVMR